LTGELMGTLLEPHLHQTMPQVFLSPNGSFGKYCMSGFKQGLVSKASLLAFASPSSQACLPMTLIEVPCDIHDPMNNCRWSKNPDRGADKHYAPFVSQFGN
jgi:hypothetical protein